ncbi:MAG TPA: zf-HC2 domain-containing protein [Candidatus Acidoferrales bacterium]|nr:zf-HC2 domain-containing protein [Candidatus Acidoferrales bacterium]HEV2422727.1 zf-HC2 domain-containing protein [Candidatus Acidoferrales bacterium]
MSEQHEQKKMAGCEKFEAWLEDYSSGELPRRDAKRLTAHLESCHECREALEDARLSGRLVAVFSEAVDLGPGFTQRVMAQIHVAERWVREQRSFWRPIEAWSWRLALSASLALALLFTYGLRSNTPVAAPEPSGVLVPQTDAFAVPISAPPSTGDEVLMAIAEKHHERY